MYDSNCQNCKKAFPIDDADLAFCQSIEVPAPTFCPTCRFQRRCAWINTRNLYLREVKPIGKTVSMYSADRKLNIVPDQSWWSDAYDVMEHGRDYDFKRPMFTQFHELLSSAPLPHLQRAYSTFENSEYCNAAAGLKSCYLVINADDSEDCMFSWSVSGCKSCVDVSCANKSELCYESIQILNCYKCLFSDDCENCSNLLFCADCVSCTDCVGCIGLRHKSHHIFNRPYSPEEYRKKMASMDAHSYEGQQKIKKEAHDFFMTKPRKAMHGKSNHNVTGDYLYQCKNVTDSLLVKKAEDGRYLQFLQYIDSPTRSCRDYTMFGVGSELMYEDAWCGLGCHNVKFSLWNYGASDLEYCMGCHYSSNLFACVGLRHKSFCILNRQYTENDYRDLVRSIKEHMMAMPYVDANGCAYRYGEFFPVELSPFAYNQTFAQEFLPINQEQAASKSYEWYDLHEPKSGEAIHSKDLPNHIEEVSNEVVAKPILCEAYEKNPSKALEHHCSQYFKIIPQELAFYRSIGVALPRHCANSRHHRRMSLMRNMQVWQRNCMKCSASIQTTYAPDRPEIVYCERCYLEAVY